MSNLTEYAEDKGLAVAHHEPTGEGGKSDESDFAIPFVTLIQASSEKVKDRIASPGDFLSSEGGVVDHIDFVPLHIQYTRDFYDADAAKNICSSQDRITGRPRDVQRFEDVQGFIDGRLACADCPYNNMDVREKLACKKGYTITGYDVNTDAPFLFRVKGAAVNVFKNRIVGAVAMKRAKPWARQYEMTAAKKSSGGNSWMSPELQPTKGHDADEMAFWATMAEGYGSNSPERDFDADLPFE